MKTNTMKLITIAFLFTLGCTNVNKENLSHNLGIDSKKNIIIEVTSPSTWYFLIFSSINKSQIADTLKLNSNLNFSLLNRMPNYDSIKILDPNHAELNDSMVLIGYREIKNFKILQFYYPSKEDKIKYIFSPDSKNKFKIEWIGLNQLDSIILKIGI